MVCPGIETDSRNEFSRKEFMNWVIPTGWDIAPIPFVLCTSPIAYWIRISKRLPCVGHVKGGLSRGGQAWIRFFVALFLILFVPLNGLSSKG